MHGASSTHLLLLLVCSIGGLQLCQLRCQVSGGPPKVAIAAIGLGQTLQQRMHRRIVQATLQALEPVSEGPAAHASGAGDGSCQ